MNPIARLERSKRVFWSRVAVTSNMYDCWPWMLKPHDPFGYGGFYFEGRTHPSHRIAWMFAKRKIPKGLCVLHRCDNPPCCNPAHLFLGTKADNAHDRHRKGRTNAARGEQQGGAKLTSADVILIRAACASGQRHKDIRARFGVSRSSVGLIANRVRWAHVS